MKFLLAWLLSIALISPAVADGEKIYSLADVDAARLRATAQNKRLLIEFTGSTWCGFCHALRTNVLSTPVFARAARQFYIIVADYPAADERSETHVRNDPRLAGLMTIKARYGVPAFPTLVLLNADGTIRRRVSGHSRDDAPTYVARLTRLD